MATYQPGKRFQVGQAVELGYNGDRARILGYYSEHMVNVRIWQGFRHVGDVCVDEADIRATRCWCGSEFVGAGWCEAVEVSGKHLGTVTRA